MKNENERLRRNVADIETLKAQVDYLKRENEALKAELEKARKSENEGIISITNKYETKITQYDQRVINLQLENDKVLK